MTIMEIHHSAMDLAGKADDAKRKGKHEEARDLFTEAFRRESDAALHLQDYQTVEPTRSILLRSAASLAVECGELREAERLISLALSGSPPEEIAEELRDLWETVNCERHLKLKGITLSPNELQISVSGNEVAAGYAPSRDVRERIGQCEVLLIRTAERIRNFPFRRKGPPPKEIAETCETYVSVPRAASVAITIRVGGNQKYLEGIDPGADIACEIIECMDLLNNCEEEDLRKRIGNEEYYQNFVGIAKQLAPDGKRIAQVGMTLTTPTGEKRIKLRRRRTDWEPRSTHKEMGATEDRVKVVGTLRYADARKGKHGTIEVVEEDATMQKVKVPISMMDDIVRPLFGYEVVITGKRIGRNGVLLEDVFRTEDV